MRKAYKLCALQSGIHSARSSGKIIAFVPTMGNIHAGHIELVRQARQRADFVVVSIYVNPTQFGADEDYLSYPKTLNEDGLILAEEGVDILFLPPDEVMYPAGVKQPTFVEVPVLGELYCGKYRPGHFRGVTTVVARLFNMVQPHVAFFGRKDYQQLIMIRRLVLDMAIPVVISAVDTVREESGLACSSRNSFLGLAERETAAKLYQQLVKVKKRLLAGKETVTRIESRAMKALEKAGFEPQFISVCRQADLAPAGKDDRNLVVLAAVRLGEARLIDNIKVRLR